MELLAVFILGAGLLLIFALLLVLAQWRKGTRPIPQDLEDASLEEELSCPLGEGSSPGAVGFLRVRGRKFRQNFAVAGAVSQLCTRIISEIESLVQIGSNSIRNFI